jgi:hypothetical protein
MTIRSSVLLVSPPHQRRPLVHEVGERLEVAICSWLGATRSVQCDESEETSKYKECYA